MGAESVAALLARGLALPDPPERISSVPPGTRCAIGGEVITEGYRVQDMVTGATAEFLDTYHGDVHGWVSVDAARCIRSANPRAGNPCARSHLVFADGTYFGPLISRESAAAQERPCWSDLARAVWPARRGHGCLALLTTDTKKRLWPRARLSSLGERTTVFVHDGGSNRSGPSVVSWPALLACLGAVEAVYAVGFVKANIGTSLYRQARLVETLGYPAVRALEATIVPWRTAPEFPVALLMAQKEGVV